MQFGNETGMVASTQIYHLRSYYCHMQDIPMNFQFYSSHKSSASSITVIYQTGGITCNWSTGVTV